MRDLKHNKYLRTLYFRYRLFLDNWSYKNGTGNKVINKGAKVKSKIQITGNNNTIEIEKGALIKDTKIRIRGNHNSLHIKKGAFISGAELWIEDNNCKLEVGENTFVGPSHLAVTEDNSSLIIGNECMLSSNINIRTGDSHSIIDIEGGKYNRINPARDIFIGEHIWIGEGAKIMKGVTLKKDIIVSSGAIVTSSFENNVLVGGIPAHIIKQNVTWNKERL